MILRPGLQNLQKMLNFPRLNGFCRTQTVYYHSSLRTYDIDIFRRSQRRQSCRRDRCCAGSDDGGNRTVPVPCRNSLSAGQCSTSLSHHSATLSHHPATWSHHIYLKLSYHITTFSHHPATLSHHPITSHHYIATLSNHTTTLSHHLATLSHHATTSSQYPKTLSHHPTTLCYHPAT